MFPHPNNMKVEKLKFFTFKLGFWNIEWSQNEHIASIFNLR